MSTLAQQNLEDAMTYAADVEAAGLGGVWEHLLADEPTPTRTMLLGILGALAVYLRETDYSPPA